MNQKELDVSDNDFSILSDEETRAAIAEAGQPDEVEQVDRTPVLNAVERADAALAESGEVTSGEVTSGEVTSGEVEQPKRTMPRRRVTKVAQKHIAQDVLANALAKALGYWREDLELRQRLEEAGIDMDQFATILKEQGDRAARALGFTEAWYA